MPVTPRVTVHAVPDPVTLAMVGAVPPMPAPALTEKFAATRPVTLSLVVTVKTGAVVPRVRAAALLARTTEVTVGAVVSMTSALALPSDPEAPGLASVRVAALPAASLIVPPLSASDVVAA
ncbi:MAG: hypothetical protein EBT00_16875 [Proteobacteria bacterium]|nr:hypothetical protein [Pseudomonadota bacterium]